MGPSTEDLRYTHIITTQFKKPKPFVHYIHIFLERVNYH